MKFRKADIAKVARETLGFFEDQNIVSQSSFDEMIGHNYFFDTEKFIEIRLADSNLRTESITCEYWIKGSGNPLNIKINASLGYYLVILKSVDSIEGYERFSELIDVKDTFGNVPQCKLVKSADVKDIKSDLESLARLG